MNNMRNNMKNSTTFGRIAKATVCGAALLGSTLALAGTAGAAASGEAELGSALSASVSMSSSGVAMIQITEVLADGTVTTMTVPANSVLNISGIEQARQSINLAAM